MGLRDEVLAKQEKEEVKNVLNNKKKSKGEDNQKVENEEPKKETKTPAKKKASHPPIEECKSNFDKLREDLDKNEVPAEWVELCDKTFEKLKIELENLKEKTFSLKVDSTKKLYKSFFYEGEASEFSPGILLNEYMTNRLKAEGFFDTSACLSSYETRYSTEEDEANYNKAVQEHFRKTKPIYDKYERELAEWNSKNAIYQDYLKSSSGGINSPSAPGRRPTYPMIPAPTKATSGVKVQYAIFLKGSLLDKKELKKHNKKEVKEKKKREKRELHPILIGLIICGAGLLLVLLGMFIFPNFREPLFELFKNYPLSTWSNISHYSKYTRALGYSLIPGLAFLGFRFLGWLFEKFVYRFF